MRSAFALGLGLLAFSFIGQSNDAHAACSYSSDALSNCGNALSDYGQKTIGHQSSSYEDVKTRVETARDTLKECYNCAMDRIEQGARDATSTSTSTSTGSDD